MTRDPLTSMAITCGALASCLGLLVLLLLRRFASPELVDELFAALAVRPRLPSGRVPADPLDLELAALLVQDALDLPLGLLIVRLRLGVRGSLRGGPCSLGSAPIIRRQLIDGGTHWVRALRVWMGEIERVVAINERPFTAMAGESLTHAIIKFQSGKSGSFDCLVRSVLSRQHSCSCSCCSCAEPSRRH